MITIDPNQPDHRALERAVDALRRGGLVLLPTETVYGLAVDPAQPAALERLYAAKGRDARKPLAYFIHEQKQAVALGARWMRAAARLADAFWPGPLTLVLPAETGEGFLGFRMPDYAPALELVRRFGPMAVTSANRSGEKEILTAQDARDLFGPLIEVYLDAGPSLGTIPSTVVQVMPDDSIRLLREGAIPSDAVFHA
ncbi:MAG: L-threonylcarbamoyladenylate synthase [Kiritimatiellae bacterium]|nr:L-threonylcarbamoyladenylate synthase [Kiritimatiellia bacterium]